MSIPAIILAAGASRRLGQPKQLVQMGDETLLARTIRIVRESSADPIFVVLGAHHQRITATVDLSHLCTVTNSNWEQGIATSIHAGIEALQESHPDSSAALLLVCDQPKLTAAHLRTLIAAHEQAIMPTIIASEYEDLAGIPAIFPASQFASLLALRGDIGARYILRNPDCPAIKLPFAGGEVDIDRPFDLGEYLRNP